MTQVLALDLARSTGWAAGHPCGQPTWGTLKLDAADEATRFLQLVTRVRTLIQEHEIDHLIVEAPYVGKLAKASSLTPLLGYRACAMVAAKTLDRLTYFVEASVWRKHLIGHGGGTRQEAKTAVIERCRWRGWAPKNIDEADALGILDYRLAVLSPEHLVMGMRKG